MYVIYNLFVDLIIFAFGMILVSLIRPRWGSFGQKPTWGRGKTCAAYVVLMIVSIVLANLTMPNE